MARNRLRIYRVSAQHEGRQYGAAASEAFPREARSRHGEAVRGGGQFFLELRYVLLARRRTARSTAPPSAQDRDAAGVTAAIRLAEVRLAAGKHLPPGGKHFDRLCSAGKGR